MRRGMIVSLLVSVVSVLVLAACGPAGASGLPGVPGNPGNPGAAGNPGPTGPVGAAGADGSDAAGASTAVLHAVGGLDVHAGDSVSVIGGGFASSEFVTFEWGWTAFEMALSTLVGCQDAKSIARNTSAANSTNPYCYDNGLKGNVQKIGSGTGDSVSGAFATEFTVPATMPAGVYSVRGMGTDNTTHTALVVTE